MLEETKSKAWFLWAYDPCPEGGWHIAKGFDTREEAEAEAKVYHEKKLKDYKERVERYKKIGREYSWNFSCYGGVMVTPGSAFSLNVDFSQEEQ